MKNYVDSTQKYITKEQQVLSICYGYGGLERGISSIIPIRTVAYVEIEAFQNFNLVAAMEADLVDKAPIWTNLKTFDGKPFHNRIHGIIGGYPCQGESTAGKRKFWNDPRFLWPYIERTILEVKPFWCFFENVSGHLTGSYPYVLASLRNLGYSVEAGIFSATEVGAPHERKRLFIFAIKMEYANDAEIKRFFFRNEKKFSNIRSSSKMADPNSSSKRGGFKKISNATIKVKNQARKKNREWLRNEFGYSDKTISNSNNKRNGESCKKHKTKQLIKNGNQWPVAPSPKQPQYEWEAKRAVKPGMGCTVNGYNFRTELLRQYGNGVVSQTAAKAFSLLLDKHIKNTNK